MNIKFMFVVYEKTGKGMGPARVTKEISSVSAMFFGLKFDFLE